MKFLIIKKNTNYELHADEVNDLIKKGGFGAWFYEDLKRAHLQHQQTLEILIDTMNKRSLSFDIVGRFEPWPEIDDYDFIITIGGDGSVLSASSQIKGNRPILIGIKSSDSSEGFLCGVDRTEIDSFFEDLLSDKVKFSSILRLQAKINRVSEGTTIISPPALNEFLYSNISPAGTTRYALNFNNNIEVQKSSGVWISTAIGSSGSVHASGASVMSPTLNQALFQVREPYKGKSLYKLISKQFNPDTDSLQIENHLRSAILSIDGTNNTIELEYADRISFEKANSLSLLLSSKRLNFHG